MVLFRKTRHLLLATMCGVFVVRRNLQQPNTTDLHQWVKLLSSDASGGTFSFSTWMSSLQLNGTAATATGGAFRRYNNAPTVVVTKVLWPTQLKQLQQMMCLFQAAYNRHVNYDWIVFTTLPWSDEQVRTLQELVPTVRVRIVLDNVHTLSEQLNAMTSSERTFLEERCQKKPDENLTWFHHCREPGTHNAANLGYSWQSEFRAFHLFTKEILQPYKYMIWMDSDAYCTKEWTHDPIQLMVEHDLVLLMDNFPQGASSNPLLLDKMRRAYHNRTVCRIELTDDGKMAPLPCGAPGAAPFYVPVVHGFHHVSNLDFYRSHLPFLKILVETHRFSREWDDQLAMTVPAAMDAPDRAWDYRRHGIHLGIQHNGNVDGKEKAQYWGMHRMWQSNLRQNWTVAREMCDKVVVLADR